MASTEYFELRKQVISATSEMDGISPCQAGMAACCVIGAPISREEFGILQDEVRQGNISQDVIETANLNAGDIRRKACVFLDDTTHTCRIYPYRPLECIDFGRGAHPRTSRGWESCHSTPERESEGYLRPPDALPRLCHNCQVEMNPGISFPLRVISSSLAVTRYYKKEIDNMRLDYAARLIFQSFDANNSG